MQLFFAFFILLEQGVDHGCHAEKGRDEGNYAKHKPLCSNSDIVTPNSKENQGDAAEDCFNFIY